MLYTKRKYNLRVAKSVHVILEWSSLIICPTRSLSMSFTNYASRDETIILQYAGLCIAIVEAYNLFGQRIWCNDSWLILL